MTIITKYKWKCYNILHLKLYASKQGLVELSEAGRRGSPGAGGAHGTPRLCPGDHDACKHRRSSAADARSWLLKCGRLLCYMTPQATSMSASARTALYCSPWAVRSLVQKFCTAPAACTHPVPNLPPRCLGIDGRWASPAERSSSWMTTDHASCVQTKIYHNFIPESTHAVKCILFLH